MRETRPPHQRAVAKNPKIAHIAKPDVRCATPMAARRGLAHDPRKVQAFRDGPCSKSQGENDGYRIARRRITAAASSGWAHSSSFLLAATAPAGSTSRQSGDTGQGDDRRCQRRRRHGRMRQSGRARLSVPPGHLLRPRCLRGCRRSVGFSAGGFRSAGQIYDPMRFVAELDGPAMSTHRRNGSLKLDWDGLRASVRWARAAARAHLGGRRTSRRASLRARRSPRSATSRRICARTARISTWPSSFEGLAIETALVDGRKFPSFSGQSDLTIQDGVEPAASAPEELRGQSGTIRTPSLSTGPDTGLTVSGPFSSARRPDRRRPEDHGPRPEGPVGVLAEAFPESRREIGNALRR